MEKLDRKAKAVRYSRYKPATKYTSFIYTQKQDRIELKHDKLWLSKIGILVKNGKYWVSFFACEIEPKSDTKLISFDKQIGVDVGSSEDNFYALDDTGEKKLILIF